LNLDTTFLVDLERKDAAALARLAEMASSGERLATTVITAAELYRGAYAHPQAERKLREVEDVLDRLIVIEMDLPAAKVYGRLHEELRRTGVTLPDRDVLIAATGLAYGESAILTRDAKDFGRVPGIRVVTY